jgi:hypothetical protein
MKELSAKIDALSSDEQDALAVEIMALMDAVDEMEAQLSPEQVAEIERRLNGDEEPLTEDQMKEFFSKLGG